MQTDATPSAAGQTQAGSVVALWRYPVKSMMGEGVNSSEVTDRGLLGDRQSSATRSPGHHRTMPPLRDDHAAAGRPTQRLRNPPDGRSAQRSKRLRLGDQ